MDWLACNEQRQDVGPSREEVWAAGTLKPGQRGRGVSGVTGLQGPSGPTLPFPTILGAGTESQWGEQLSWGRGGGGGSLWVTFWLRRAWFWGSSWRPQGWGGPSPLHASLCGGHPAPTTGGAPHPRGQRCVG